MLRIAYLVFFILILIPYTSLAETKIIFAEHKYIMGDNDSKNDARRMRRVSETMSQTKKSLHYRQ